jgi:hypothetical protein
MRRLWLLLLLASCGMQPQNKPAPYAELLQ